jgi:hypothetical protein
MRSGRLLTALLIAASLTRCALYSDVSIQPLIVTPANIERGSDLQAMLRKADYLRAMEMAAVVDSRTRKSPSDLLALGTAESAAGRLTVARQHLRASMENGPTRQHQADAAWALSQLEYLDNNFAASLEWAKTAGDHGLSVLKWHLDYLEALQNTPVYRFAGLPSDQIPLEFGRPDVPRLKVRLNKSRESHVAVIDSGAVLSIVSQRFATLVNLKRLPVERGTFYGLLGEPIAVEFGLIDSLELGAVEVHNVPVAIMPDDKMRFLVSDKREFRIDFLLGANLLKEFRIELNFTNQHVTFTRLTARDKQPAADQNLFFSGFRPHVRGTVNRHGWFMFVLDTGSEVTYLNEAQLASLPLTALTAPRMHNATLQGLGGAKKRGAKIENIELGIDRWAGIFRTIPMYSASAHDVSVGLIGQNYLKNFNVVLDFGRMRLDLARR